MLLPASRFDNVDTMTHNKQRLVRFLQIMMNYLGKKILLGFDTDRTENLLNVLGVDLVAGEGGEESGGHVTHF